MGCNKPHVFGIRNFILSFFQMASIKVQQILRYMKKEINGTVLLFWLRAHCMKAWHKFAGINMQTQICMFYERSWKCRAHSWDKNQMGQAKEVTIWISREVHWEGIGKISDDWCKAIFKASLITRKAFKGTLSQRQRGNRKNAGYPIWFSLWAIDVCNGINMTWYCICSSSSKQIYESTWTKPLGCN